ncbi:MAG: hypothetical protein J6C19_04915 [Lachnospiraceae bacterium]|nr:hypothetical protein [Lachnospiraceae bacterium]
MQLVVTQRGNRVKKDLRQRKFIDHAQDFTVYTFSTKTLSMLYTEAGKNYSFAAVNYSNVILETIK